MSLLRWIWGLLKQLLQWVWNILAFLAELAQSVVAWIVAGIAYLVHLVVSYVGGLIVGAFEAAEDVALPDLPVYPLAHWLAHDLLALDIAFAVFAIYVSVWVATRIGRASFSVVRLMIDLL